MFIADAIYYLLSYSQNYYKLATTILLRKILTDNQLLFSFYFQQFKVFNMPIINSIFQYSGDVNNTSKGASIAILTGMTYGQLNVKDCNHTSWLIESRTDDETQPRSEDDDRDDVESSVSSV